VTPGATTTYVLTAKNSLSEESSTTTVVINAAKFLYCFASPTNVRQGESTTLTWLSSGASGVTISPTVGPVGANGSVAVSPTANTTYTMTTTSSAAGGPQADSCSVTVSVTRGPVPTIARFSTDQITIENGTATTLQWAVTNADSVSISTLGDVPLVGSRELRPSVTTTYVLTATNASGSTTAQVTVNVFTIPPPRILSFTVDKPTIPAPSTPVQLTCRTADAFNVLIANAGFYTATAVLDAWPPADTTYTCTATNTKGQSVSQTVSVKIVP
jgi:hypothetical protein